MDCSTLTTSRFLKEQRVVEKMHFTRMDQGSDEDFQILKHVHEKTLAEQKHSSLTP
ncbi:MAG TPA: hypothetical protein VIW95_02085 [Candidatus Binatus sp.]|uniref:hypothetical protein n=1 Tax=Candidatus Binatus sp. TaxID=2811406 RepID=UPI002F42D138